ncbi:DUF5134 domain-containing protein [Streptomyces sp. NPDC002851]
MHGPPLAGWLLVTLCAATGAYCLLRMRSSVAAQRHSAGGEAVMGFGMAVMAVPAAVFAPPPVVWLGLAAVFGAAALHTVWSATRSAAGGGSGRQAAAPDRLHQLHHLLGALAMVYMSVAMAAVPAEHAAHHRAQDVPLLTGALFAYYAVHVLWSGTRLVPVAAPAAAGGPAAPPPPRSWGDRPELVLACRVSMGIAMLVMLLTM